MLSLLISFSYFSVKIFVIFIFKGLYKSFFKKTVSLLISKIRSGIVPNHVHSLTYCVRTCTWYIISLCCVYRRSAPRAVLLFTGWMERADCGHVRVHEIRGIREVGVRAAGDPEDDGRAAHREVDGRAACHGVPLRVTRGVIQARMNVVTAAVTVAAALAVPMVAVRLLTAKEAVPVAIGVAVKSHGILL